MMRIMKYDERNASNPGKCLRMTAVRITVVYGALGNIDKNVMKNDEKKDSEMIMNIKNGRNHGNEKDEI